MRRRHHACRYERPSPTGLPAWLHDDDLRVADAVLMRASGDSLEPHVWNDVLWLALICEGMAFLPTEPFLVDDLSRPFLRVAATVAARLPTPPPAPPYVFADLAPLRLALAVCAGNLAAPLIDAAQPYDLKALASAVNEARCLAELWQVAVDARLARLVDGGR